MFLPGRYADVTDVLFLSSGALAGLGDARMSSRRNATRTQQARADARSAARAPAGDRQ